MAGYTEDDIKSLDWREHIRLRPGMYIGKLGDGSSQDDGIYILLKEVIDNAIDEFVMGHGKEIHIEIDEGGRVEVRDFGRGIPLGKLFDCAAQINTGAKYDSEAFKKSVGLNGVGIKAVNALSGFFEIQAWRDGKTKAIEFSKGEVIEEMKRPNKADKGEAGTRLAFEVDNGIFPKRVKWRDAFVERMCRYYSFLNPGLCLVFNGKKYKSKHGLLDLLKEEMDEEPLYEPIVLKGHDIDVVFSHTQGSSEEYYSFVNGQHTTQGGTHLAAFREALVKTIREFYKKQWDPADIRSGIEAAISVRVEEPVFESQTKTKLGSTHMAPEGETVRTFIGNFLKEELDNYLHKHSAVADELQKRILQAERERKELKGGEEISTRSSQASQVT